MNLRTKLTVLSFFSFSFLICAQSEINYQLSKAFFDSLEVRINYFEKKVPELKKARDTKYLITQQQLEKTEFVYHFESFVSEEDLFKARDLVREQIVKAELFRDRAGKAFYKMYLDRVNTLIKYQKMHYQELFAKEKNFRKATKKLLKEETIEAYLQAKRNTLLAIKYAGETGLSNTTAYLYVYLNHVEALILDEQSEFDLEKLTNNEKFFFESFKPLVKSDSLQLIKRADSLLLMSKSYASKTLTEIDTNFFIKQQRVVVTATSDYYYRQGNSLEEIAEQVVQGSLLRENENGVFKWGDYILVIDVFEKSASFKNVNRGAAILKADKKLFEYLRLNDLADLDKGLKVGQAFVVPFVVNGNKKDFMYNPLKNQWQYMVCYTQIENKSFTQEVSKYMKPITFRTNASSRNLVDKMQ